MRMFSINQWQIICRWWRYGKLSAMPVILKPWRRSNLRFWSLTRVTITWEHDSVWNDFWAHGFFNSFFQIKEKLEAWSDSFQEAFDNKDFDRAVEATQRMRYYERAVEETVKKLWSSITAAKGGEAWNFFVRSLQIPCAHAATLQPCC